MAVYGTAFEELSDEERDAVKKKPKSTQDEIVTDERGKRRFHGAFTGGFAAGYFNTAGSKHGWVPQTFKSSRESRAEQAKIGVEDFMDEEDFGEFGIASKRIRTKSDFLDSLSTPGEKNQLAWERSIFSSSTSTEKANLTNSITSSLMEMLKPVNDSIGIRLMKKMGWRAGKGVGPSMSRRALEKQKVIDASGRGETVHFDENAVREVESIAPGVEFCPTDTQEFEFKPKENVHGLGYVPLQESGVLAQTYGSIATGLKANRKGKAIRGQAFGVGAFEDEDEDIYTSYDLSQYDFEVGATTSTNEGTARFDSTFVPSKKPFGGARKFFEAPKPPPGYRPIFKPTPMAVANLSERVLKVGERLTPFERAKFLGDRDNSVLELLSDKDRKFLTEARSKTSASVAVKPTTRKNVAEPFEEEPIKNHRFKQFVQYLKRGIDYPQPIALTRLEWEKELSEFEEVLTPELRALLPEVSARQKPLAKVEFSQPIAEQLKSRFQTESNAEEEADSKEKSVKHHKDHDRIQAVRMKMFGEMTRIKYQWYPSKELCKRFNVPNPYPSSALVGVPELQKRRATNAEEMDFTIVGGNAALGLPNTANELAARKELQDRKQTNVNNDVEFLNWDNAESNAQAGVPNVMESKPEGDNNNAPFALLQALFEESSSDDSSDNSSSDDEEDVKSKPHPTTISPNPNESTSLMPDKNVKDESVIVEKVITVFDLVEDDDVYGPKPPPKIEESNALPSTSSEIVHDRDEWTTANNSRRHTGIAKNEEFSDVEKSSKTKGSKKHKKREHKAKHRKREKEERKHKKKSKKKHRTRSHERSSSAESSEIEIIG